MQPVERPRPPCLMNPTQNIVDLLGKSYVLEIIYTLTHRDSSIRFNELKRKMTVTATTLSRRLEDLISSDLVLREVYSEVPARVEYSLSEKGRSFSPILRNLFRWIDENYGSDDSI